MEEIIKRLNKVILEVLKLKNIPNAEINNIITIISDIRDMSINEKRFVYSIEYGQYKDTGCIDKLAQNEESIIKLVKADESVNATSGKGIINVTVDFSKEIVYYDYIDYDDEIEQEILYLTKYEII